MFGDAYVRTILDALSANHITLNKASSYLDNLKIKDLPFGPGNANLLIGSSLAGRWRAKNANRESGVPGGGAY